MPKVFILNRGAHDFSAAKHFGDLVYCTEGNLGKFNTSQMVRELEPTLADSKADDYILLTSLSTLCSVACSIMSVKHKKLNILLFKDGKYIPRSIVFE